MKTLTKFEWLMVFGVGVAAAMSIYRGDPDALLSSFAAITGIICVILCSKGKRSSYIWGFINVLAYAWLAFRATFYGEVMLNALYFMPTQFIGWYYWSKHLNNETNEVKSKVMTWKQILGWGAATLITIFFVAKGLEFIGTGQFYAGAVSLTLSLIANILMVKRYAEQWPIWIFVNIASIYMWIQYGDWVQVTMWSMYLLNAFYGWYLWVDRKNKYNYINQ
jgi:nicotinamide mononucleotide transporter